MKTRGFWRHVRCVALAGSLALLLSGPGRVHALTEMEQLEIETECLVHPCYCPKDAPRPSLETIRKYKAMSLPGSNPASVPNWQAVLERCKRQAAQEPIGDTCMRRGLYIYPCPWNY